MINMIARNDMYNGVCNTSTSYGWWWRYTEELDYILNSPS